MDKEAADGVSPLCPLEPGTFDVLLPVVNECCVPVSPLDADALLAVLPDGRLFDDLVGVSVYVTAKRLEDPQPFRIIVKGITTPVGL